MQSTYSIYMIHMINTNRLLTQVHCRSLILKNTHFDCSDLKHSVILEKFILERVERSNEAKLSSIFAICLPSCFLKTFRGASLRS